MAPKLTVLVLVVLGFACVHSQIVFPDDEDDTGERFGQGFRRPQQQQFPQQQFPQQQFQQQRPPQQQFQQQRPPQQQFPQQQRPPQQQFQQRPPPQQQQRPPPQQQVPQQPQQQQVPQQPQQQQQFGGQTPPPTASPTAPTTTDSPEYLECLRNCPSTSEYNPVCGSDSVDYHNEQRLVCASRCGQNVQLLRRGLCRPRG